MARVGIISGLLLCGLTFLALVGTSAKSPTQFIPMMLGIPVLFCGVVALNPHRRKHAMHAAATIAFLGAVAGAGRAIYILVEMIRGNEVSLYAFKLVVAMTVLCAAFVVICVRSFVESRQRINGGGPSNPRATIHLHQTSNKDGSPPEVNSRESA